MHEHAKAPAAWALETVGNCHNLNVNSVACLFGTSKRCDGLHRKCGTRCAREDLITCRLPTSVAGLTGGRASVVLIDLEDALLA